jgi:hypothetical protein
MQRLRGRTGAASASLRNITFNVVRGWQKKKSWLGVTPLISRVGFLKYLK